MREDTLPSSARITDRQLGDRHPGSMEETRRCLMAMATRRGIKAMAANTATKRAMGTMARTLVMAQDLLEETCPHLKEGVHRPWDGHHPEIPPEATHILLDEEPGLRLVSLCRMDVAAGILTDRGRMLVCCVLCWTSYTLLTMSSLFCSRSPTSRKRPGLWPVS